MASKALTKRIEPEHDRIRAVYARRSALDGRYSWFSSGHVYLMQERERRVLALLRRLGVDGLADRNILEIGCGTAHWLRDFIKWGASPERLVGVDLVADRVVEAKRLSPPGVTVTSGSAAALDLSNESMDVVIQSTVFTSILDSSLRRQVASEMLKVSKPDGLFSGTTFMSAIRAIRTCGASTGAKSVVFSQTVASSFSGSPWRRHSCERWRPTPGWPATRWPRFRGSAPIISGR